VQFKHLQRERDEYRKQRDVLSKDLDAATSQIEALEKGQDTLNGFYSEIRNYLRPKADPNNFDVEADIAKTRRIARIVLGKWNDSTGYDADIISDVLASIACRRGEIVEHLFAEAPKDYKDEWRETSEPHRFWARLDLRNRSRLVQWVRKNRS
jgi:hypothetical protein